MTQTKIEQALNRPICPVHGSLMTEMLSGNYLCRDVCSWYYDTFEGKLRRKPGAKMIRADDFDRRVLTMSSRFRKAAHYLMLARQELRDVERTMWLHDGGLADDRLAGFGTPVENLRKMLLSVGCDQLLEMGKEAQGMADVEEEE